MSNQLADLSATTRAVGSLAEYVSSCLEAPHAPDPTIFMMNFADLGVLATRDEKADPQNQDPQVLRKQDLRALEPNRKEDRPTMDVYRERPR